MRPPELQWVRWLRPLVNAALATAILGATHVATAGASTQAQRTDAGGQDTAVNIAPRPNFMSACVDGSLDNSRHCVSAISRAFSHALSSEGTPYAIHFADLSHKSPAVQLFVAANIDRAARGLPPITHLLSDLNALAKLGVVSNSDPALSGSARALVGGQPVVGWGSNWASATYNALGTEYFWMYEDGPGGYNLGCHSATDSGCNGHRANILATYAPSRAFCPNNSLTLSMGAAAAIENGTPAFAEIFVATCNSPTEDVVDTWSTLEPISPTSDGTGPGTSSSHRPFPRG